MDDQNDATPDAFADDVTLVLPSEGDMALKLAEAEAMALAEHVMQISPKVCVAKLDDGYAVDYERKFHPLCKICNSEHRNDAERVYLLNNHNCKAVQRWCEEIGFEVGYDSITNHMKNHCTFEPRAIDLIGKLYAREDDIDRVLGDPLQFCKKVVVNAIQELGAFDLSKDPKNAAYVTSIILQATKTMAMLEKTQEDVKGSMVRAQAMLDAKNKRIERLLDALMETATEEQGALIIAAVREFQKDGAGS